METEKREKILYHGTGAPGDGGGRRRKRRPPRPRGKDQICATSVHVNESPGFTSTSRPPSRPPETPLDCEVALWSSWGLCLGSCSRGGVRHRSRYILLRPANAGTPCPELEEQAECTHHNCLRRQ
ncbi:unnamed protein product [Arctogadus glacialis]